MRDLFCIILIGSRALQNSTLLSATARVRTQLNKLASEVRTCVVSINDWAAAKTALL